MIISMSIDPHKALQYQSSSQKEKWILLSEIIQTLDRVQPQKTETSFFLHKVAMLQICSIVETTFEI